MSLRTRNSGLGRPRLMMPYGPGAVNAHDTRSGAGRGHIGHPQPTAARSIPGTKRTHTRGRLVAAALIAALCGGCGQDEGGAAHVSELTGQWTGKERGGQRELRFSLREDGTFEWHEQQARGKKDTWSPEGRWKLVSLSEEDEKGLTYCLELSVGAGESDAATAGPQPGTYEVRLSPRPTARDWMLCTPWGEFTVQRETGPEEPAGRERAGETRDG